MLQNLHTHCTYCDGRDTPREMIEEAISRGFDSIGFSSHATDEMRGSFELLEKTDDYCAEITRLKSEYSNRIKIYLGTELDYYSASCLHDFPYDYKIGSVHMTKFAGEYIIYDHSPEHTRRAINELLGGNPESYVKLYYETVAELPRKIDFDFVGHFDLISKFAERAPELIDLNSDFYRRCALEALHAVRERHELFEMNTGTIGRGYKSTPYPAPFILDEMKALGCKIILSSDCHNKSFLDAGFREARELLLAHGIDELYYLTDSGFRGEKIRP